MFAGRYKVLSIMPGSTCIVCGSTKKKAEKMSMFRIPAEPNRKKQWLEVLSISEDDIHNHTRVCSRHFVHGDSSNLPSLNLGKRFASPRKKTTARGIRAQKRTLVSPSVTPPSLSKNLCLQTSSSVVGQTTCSTDTDDPMCAPIGEPLLSDSSYGVHELPSEHDDRVTEVALKAKIEYLEAESSQSLYYGPVNTTRFFQVEQIANNDDLIRFYTGFRSYSLFLLFFEFLGPATHQLEYWGDAERKTSRRRKTRVLSPLNQYFLTLVKLRLNLRERDLAYRFGVSTAFVSKIFVTWVCFMYHQLREIDWTPSMEQVASTLPSAFQGKYSRTYSIIDATEFFLETPSDLFMQSSTWSNYKHKNTAKALIGCTPNGAVSFVSRLYVGSISDVELTRVCGYLDTLDGKRGASVMADRGFTVRDLLQEKGVDLNIPPFMEGRQQLSATDVQSGRGIASLRIHVERLIGRIKNYAILKGTLPITMIRIADQIFSVCAWLTNFQPVLIPLPSDESAEQDVERYLQSMEDDYDADSESSDTDI